MIPFNRYMDSYPQPHPCHHGNHVHYPHPCYPSHEAVTPQTKVEPVNPSVSHEPWSYGCSYGYPNQMECHGCGCCNNIYPPGCYSFRPLHPQPHPAPIYYHGTYPSHPENYPPFHVPPSYYSVEQPKYEYDTSMHRKPCCGCPNHAWDQKEGKKDTKRVTIEEMNPVELTTNHPLYPFVWTPPEYMLKDKETAKPLESRVSNGWFPSDIKSSTESGKASEPKGWFPLNLNNIKSLTQAGDEERIENQHGEGKKVQYPFPMIWVPSNEKQESVGQNDCKECNTPVEEMPAKLKIVPVNSLKAGQADKPNVSEGTSSNGFGSTTMQKERPENVTLQQTEENGMKKSPEYTVKTVKNIPVKQAQENEKMSNKSSPSPPKTMEKEEPENVTLQQTGENGMKKSPEDTVKTVKNIPVKQAQENEKMSNKSYKRPSPSPPKASKLPPVCLRVDPLPKGKNSKGTLRSPSRPGSPSHSGSKSQPNKASQDSGVKGKVQNKAGDVQSEKVIKVTEVKDGKSDHKKESSMDRDKPPIQINVPVVPTKEYLKATINSPECKTEETEESVKAVERKSNHEKKLKNELSGTEAAILIQSAYRGFEVRRWEPLKKLRQIAKVREQVGEVRKRVHSLESMKDEKEKMVIGEIIMSLLLQLDTIQGLHPSVRDIRKLVARELVCLQGKLDSLTIQEPEEVEEAKVMVPAETKEEESKELIHDNEQAAETENAEHVKNFSQEVVDEVLPLTVATDEKEPQQLLETSTGNVDEQLSVDMNLQHGSSNVIGGDMDLVDANDQSTLASVNLKGGVNDEDPMNIKEGVNEDPGFKEVEVPQIVKEVPESAEELREGTQNTNEVLNSHEPLKVNGYQEEPRENPENVNEVPESETRQNMNQMQVPKSTKELREAPEKDNEVPESAELPQVMYKVDEIEGVPKEVEVPALGVQSTPVVEAVELRCADEAAEPDASVVAEMALEVVDELFSTCNLQENIKLESRKDKEGVLAKPLEKECKVPMEVEEEAPAQRTEEKTLLSESEGAAIGFQDNTPPDPDAEGDGECEDGRDNYWVVSGTAVEVEHKEGKESQVQESEAVVNSAAVEDVPSAENADVAALGTPELGGTKDNVLAEENEKLREMVEKLVEAGKQQLAVISDLNGRVKDLERKLVKKKKKKLKMITRHKAVADVNNLSRENVV